MVRGMARMVPVALAAMAPVVMAPVVMAPGGLVGRMVPVRPAVLVLPRRRQQVWPHRHLPAWPRRQWQTAQSLLHPSLLRSGRRLPHQPGRLIRRPDAVRLITAI